MADSLTYPALGIASLLIGGAYFYTKLLQKRSQNAHFPQLPPSLLMGHLMVFDEFTKRGIVDRHPDVIFAEMHDALGKPPFFLVDNRPIVPPMIIVASHEVAEQISRPSKDFPYSVTKSSSVDRIFDLIGPHSILLKQNEEWKQVRKRFNPGFAPQHLMTLLPIIIEKCSPYLDILDGYVASEKTFSLDEPTTNLTFDIIGAVIMGEDMNAQHLDPADQGDIIVPTKQLIKTFADDKLQLPWWLMPRTHLKRHRLGAQVSQQLRKIVRRNFEDIRAGIRDGVKTKSRTVLTLSLHDIEELTPEIMEETCDQLKTFLFAGHDTTSTTIIWSIYELSRTPHALKAVRDELDEIFGPREAAANGSAIDVVREKLLAPNGGELVHRMTYTSAVIKEVLRLHPPAGSIREAKPGTKFAVSTPQGGTQEVDGRWLYLNHNIIHRDRSVFGDTADDFVPERWLPGKGGDGDESYPASAWRPFERGPRNCIGQDLANIEARVIIAMLARHYEFVKVSLGEFQLDHKAQPMVDDKGRFKVVSELYSTIQISGKPVDGMMMKVKHLSG